MIQRTLAAGKWCQISKSNQDSFRSFPLRLPLIWSLRSLLVYSLRARRLHVEQSLFCRNDLFGGDRGCPSEWSSLHSGHMRTVWLPCGCGGGPWDCRVEWTLNYSQHVCTTRPYSSSRSSDFFDSSSSIRSWSRAWTPCCVACFASSTSLPPSMSEGNLASRESALAWNYVRLGCSFNDSHFLIDLWSEDLKIMQSQLVSLL